MRVLGVECLEGYKLKLLFSDNETKVVDLKEKLKDAKGVFLPLKDPEYFKQVAVDDDCASICWPNGADICPDLLYRMGKTVRASRKKSAAKVKRRKTVKSRSK